MNPKRILPNLWGPLHYWTRKPQSRSQAYLQYSSGLSWDVLFEFAV